MTRLMPSVLSRVRTRRGRGDGSRSAVEGANRSSGIWRQASLQVPVRAPARLVDERADFLAQFDEARVRRIGPIVAAARELANEVDVEAGDDAARPRRHHDDGRAEQQRFLDRMGDEKDLLAGLGPDRGQQAAASSRASGCRARRTARPSAGSSDRWPAPARCRRAGACRRTARRAAFRRNRRARRVPSKRLDRSWRSRVARPGISGRAQHCRARWPRAASVSFWKTTPRSPPGATISFPSSVIVPSVSGRKPAMALSRVDFPHPEAPTATTMESAARCRATPDQVRGRSAVGGWKGDAGIANPEA